MKRTLLSVAVCLTALLATAQCTPNTTLYQDSIFGAWPDTITDFAPGAVGVFYSDTIDLLVPSDAGLIDPLGSGSTIDSIALVSVTNLPPGIGYQCTSHTPAPCTFLPTIVGCAVLEGTPTQVGEYEMTIDVLAYVSLIFGGQTTFPYQFPGYQINIGSVGVEESSVGFTKVTNVPNPFSETTSIKFSVSSRTEVEFKVYDLLGAELHDQDIIAQPGANAVNFDGSLLEGGIYLYELRSGAHVFTGRMVLDR